MFYIQFYFNDSYKELILPEEKNWNGAVTITHSGTGWKEDVRVDVRVLDGIGYITTPKDYQCDGSNALSNEYKLQDKMRLLFISETQKISVVVSVWDCIWTAMQKYQLPINTAITLGRNKDATICVDSPLVSAVHGKLIKHSDGSCVYYDVGRNATYHNNHKLEQSECLLHCCDVLLIAPGLKIVYLGDNLAINHPKELSHVKLSAWKRPTFSQSDLQQEAASSLLEYHRAPRLMEKPNIEPVEIDPPLSKAAPGNQPLFLTLGPSFTMILPMLMGSFITSMGGTSGGYMKAGIAMIGTSSALAAMWGCINIRYRKKQELLTEKKRFHLYAAYIQDKEKQIRAMYECEYKRLLKEFPSSKECLTLGAEAGNRLWERMPTHSDFMDVRIGLGLASLPNEIKIPKQQLSLIDDELRNEPNRLKKQYSMISKAPVCLPLRTETVVGLLGKTSLFPIATSIVVQLAALQSYHDVKIVILTKENEYSQWEWARWLPHVFPTEGRNLRMVVSEPQAVREVLNHLEEVIQIRTRNDAPQEKNTASQSDGSVNPEQLPLPHYVVFCMDIALLESEHVLAKLVKPTPGFTLVAAASQMDRLPKECRVLISTIKKHAGLYTATGNETPLAFEPVSKTQAAQFSKQLARVRVLDSAGSASIPTLVSFLELYHVYDVQSLDVWRFWNEHHAYEGLQAVIGLRSGGQPFTLDISDKRHGPHGLIAGTTGSGKSVMLQTYILSLALNYSPREVQFILIDYKGGGMADAFAALPHLAGIIDNLQGTRQIKRALASIQGEIRRREKIFKEASVSSIDEYMRLISGSERLETISHLIIIVDEFAELRKEQPEFMHELISASRVGRSVGLHLILATQKPSASVDDEIWSNARFRICLRVQNRSDSMEMLKRPDAAYIKGMGRCYVQIGNDEIFEEVQTSWSGAEYQPNKTVVLEKPAMLNQAGQPMSIRKKSLHSAKPTHTQMEATLRRIAEVARQQGVENARRLWLDELPDTVFLSSLAPFSSQCYHDGKWPQPTARGIHAFYALADDLQNQRYFPVALDFAQDRNYMIVGLGATGKTTLLQTVALSVCCHYSPELAQLYVLSLSSHTLGYLRELPNVGDIIFEGKPEEAIRLVYMLAKESERRRTLFEAAATDNFTAYSRTREVEPALPAVPAILVLVDRMAQLLESIPDSHMSSLYNLIKEGSGRGIYFVVTAMSVAEVPSKVRDCFKGIALQLHERGDYQDVLGRRLPDELCNLKAVSGRGTVVTEDGIYEMQTALYGRYEADAERALCIRSIAKEMNAAWHGARPAPMKRIPEQFTWADHLTLLKTSIATVPCQIPIGYYAMDATIASLNIQKQYAWLILGGKSSGKTCFLKGIALMMQQLDAELYFWGGDALKAFAASIGATILGAELQKQQSFHRQLEKMILQRNNQRKSATSSSEQEKIIASFRPYAIFIDDLPDQLSVMTSEMKRLLSECCSLAEGYQIYVFITANTNSLLTIRRDELFQSIVASQNGLSLCGKLNESNVWDAELDYTLRNRILPIGQAYIVDHGNVQLIQIPKP